MFRQSCLLRKFAGHLCLWICQHSGRLGKPPSGRSECTAGWPYTAVYKSRCISTVNSGCRVRCVLSILRLWSQDVQLSSADERILTSHNWNFLHIVNSRCIIMHVSPGTDLHKKSNAAFIITLLTLQPRICTATGYIDDKALTGCCGRRGTTLRATEIQNLSF